MTPHHMLPPRARRSIGWDLAVLTALCVPLYALFPTNFGLRDTQESLRVLAAWEMAASGDWMVPTIHGQVYVAKPPLIYWCQLWLNTLRGGEPIDGLEIRLTAALAGWLGVIATYLLVRQLLGARSPPQRADPDCVPWASSVAWWAALFLAVGPVYVRESRVGHIDTLLVPPTVIGVWGIASAWRAQRQENRTHWAAIGVAVLAATVAILTKGPPGMAAMAAAGYGGIALHAAWGDARLGAPPRRLIFAGSLLCGIALAGLAWVNSTEALTVKTLVGTAVIFVAGFGVFWTVARLANAERLRLLWAGLRRTHPWLVLGLPLIALWGWAEIVFGRVGETAFQYRGAGADLFQLRGSNVALVQLNVLMPYAPFNYLELLGYGLGLGSIAAIAAVVWMVKDRPRIEPSWWIVLAWALITFLVFALLSRGTRRYVMFMWPAVATLGAMWFVSALRDRRAGRSLAIAAYAIVLVSGVGLGWWYSIGREIFMAHHSPRALVEELIDRGADPARIATLDFFEPAADVYAGHLVRFFVISDSAEGAYPHKPVPIEALVEELEASGCTYTLLVRAGPAGRDEVPADVARLERFGLTATPLPHDARLVIDKDTRDVRAVEVRARGR